MKTISRYIMTLALLLTAATGAWADIAVGDVFKTGSTIDFGTTSVRYKTYSGSSDNSTLGATGKQTLTYQQYTNGKHWFNISTGSGGQSIYIVSDNTAEPWGIKVSGGEGTMGNPYSFEVLFEAPFFDLPLVSQPGAKPQLWEFEMPAFDVVLTPIYAKAAAFATTGSEPEATTLLPEAAEGIIAGTDASLIAEGTGIVAFAGTSTEVTQGTLMYAIGTSATTAPALTAFSTTVPTAKDYDDAATVYVWYYIKGADAPDGEAATLDNTFDNTDPACLTVTVLTNKFDITFKAANANTIEAGKATVTVGGTAATVTEGKLQGVKMGSEVKLEAKPGYKFRKVEVKKKVITMLNAATTENIGMVVCNAGHLHDAKTAVPAGCTAVGILGKVTEIGHGLILALKNATNQTWNTINGWASASYAGTTLKVLPDDGARSTNLSSYTTLGETTVSNWAVAQKSDYVAIFQNLGSAKNSGGYTYDNNVNAYITTDVGGTAMSGTYWSATPDDDYDAWYFHASSWYDDYNTSTYYVRPVLGF